MAAARRQEPLQRGGGGGPAFWAPDGDPSRRARRRRRFHRHLETRGRTGAEPEGLSTIRASGGGRPCPRGWRSPGDRTPMILLDTCVISEIAKASPHPSVLAWMESVADDTLRLS